MQLEIITLLIPPGMWRDTEGDGSRLHCTIDINGTLMHLEAIHVHYVGTDEEQEAVNDKFTDAFHALFEYGGEGAFETTQINGNDYVLVALPFQ